MAKRKGITICLGKQERGELQIIVLRDWLDELLEEVPNEHKHSVMVEIGDDGDCEVPQSMLSVYYSRTETQEEADQREAASRSRRAEQIERDIANARAILARHGVSIGE